MIANDAQNSLMLTLYLFVINKMLCSVHIDRNLLFLLQGRFTSPRR